MTDPDPAVLIAIAAARGKPAHRSYDTYQWPREKMLSAAVARTVKSQRRHDAIVASGTKRCTICGEVFDLDHYGIKSLPNGQPRYRSACRSCDSRSKEKSRRRNQRTGE